GLDDPHQRSPRAQENTVSAWRSVEDEAEKEPGNEKSGPEAWIVPGLGCPRGGCDPCPDGHSEEEGSDRIALPGGRPTSPCDALPTHLRLSVHDRHGGLDRGEWVDEK